MPKTIIPIPAAAAFILEKPRLGKTKAPIPAESGKTREGSEKVQRGPSCLENSQDRDRPSGASCRYAPLRMRWMWDRGISRLGRNSDFEIEDALQFAAEQQWTRSASRLSISCA